MRLLSLLLQITGYGALWVAIVLVCGVIGVLSPVLWNVAQPSSSENYGAGLAMMFWGMAGLVAGTLPATVCVMLLADRSARRSREESLRLRASRA
jgi:hypothetical protein